MKRKVEMIVNRESIKRRFVVTLPQSLEWALQPLTNADKHPCSRITPSPCMCMLGVFGHSIALEWGTSYPRSCSETVKRPT